VYAKVVEGKNSNFGGAHFDWLMGENLYGWRGTGSKPTYRPFRGRGKPTTGRGFLAVTFPKGNWEVFLVVNERSY